MKKKMVSMLLCAGMALSMLAGCSQADGQSTAMAAGKETAAETQKMTETKEAAEAQKTTETKEAAEAQKTTEMKETAEVKEAAETAAPTEAELVEGNYKIGIAQFAQHGSLDNCREGFLLGLKEEGFVEGENLEIDYQNSDADMGTAGTIAQGFAAKGVDLMCGIATPAAQACYNAALKTEIPTIYTAVTDPVAAELASEDQMPAGNATGTSDKLPVEAQLKMIRELLPEAKTIGIIYTTSEVNSESTIKEYEALVGEYGFTLETVGIATIADVPSAADTILEKADCLNNLTDNTVVSALPTILDKANKKGIPVFGSEVEQVKIGCLASEGIDYIALGKQTGRMAAQVLKGEKKAEEMPFESITESSLYLNTKVAENLGITVNDDVKNRAIEIFTEIEE